MGTNADSAAEPIGSNMTAIEHRCLKFTSEAQTVQEIGGILGLEPALVEAYLRRAQTKLGAVNCVHAIVMAVRHNIL